MKSKRVLGFIIIIVIFIISLKIGYAQFERLRPIPDSGYRIPDVGYEICDVKHKNFLCVLCG